MSSSSDATWREWLRTLPDYEIVSDVGLQHVLLDHRTVQAQDTYRRLGEYLVFLINRDGLTGSPPVAGLSASEYHAYRRTRRKQSTRAADLIARAMDDEGQLDMDKLVLSFLAGSQKRTTYMSILYSLEEVNPQWAAQWREKLPQGKPRP